MRTYYCISSIQMEIPENASLNDEKRKYFKYIICGFDNYSLTKCSVFVAPDNTVQLKIERNNQIIYIPLKHESIIIKFSDTINNIIDLEFDDAEFRLGALDRLMVKSMRIRNIKNSSIKGFSEDDKQNFKSYLKLVYDNIRKKVLKLNPSLNPNDDLSQILTTKYRNIREKEFDKIKMPSDGKHKSLTNSFRDLKTVIEFFNKKENEGKIPDDIRLIGTASEIAARKMISINTQRLYAIEKQRNQKLHWQVLEFIKIKMRRFDDIWFDALNLTDLSLYNCEISDTNDEAWNIFANGIEKLKNLKIFNISANLDSIPDIVFQKLPDGIIQMDLSSNNFQLISHFIFMMKNLKILSLANNPRLSQISWNVTSKTLTRLNLSYTDVTLIPKDINGFSLLQHLNLTGTRLKTLELDVVQLKELKLGYVEKIETINAPFIELFEITNTDLRETNITTLISKFPKLNQLILINIGLNQLVFPKILPKLKTILLSKNNLTSFPWESISNQCNHLDLSNNEIEILGSPKFWSNIKWLNLKDNKIHIIDIDGCDFENFKHNPEGDDIRFRKELNLQNNPIKNLQIGFEKLEFITSLNISGVQIDSYDLENKLWKRLPQSLKILNISQIPVAILPCNINNLSKLIANDCKLRWICPYISKNLTMLEITENPEIKSFPFVPDEVFFYPKNKLKAETEESEVFGNTLYDLDEAFTFLTDYSFQDMKDANENYLNYTFKKIYENQPNYCCKCCAQCGEETDEPLVEELMTMDCNMYVKKPKIVESWDAEEWKVWVKTRLCEKCIDTFKRESIKLNEEHRIKVEKMKEKEETKKRKSINNEENAVSSKGESSKKSPNPSSLMIPVDKVFNEQEFDNNHLTLEYTLPSDEQYQQVNDSSYYQQMNFLQQEIGSTSSSFVSPAKFFPTSSDHLHLPSHERIPESSLSNYQTVQQMPPQQYYCANPNQNEHQYVLANTTDSNDPPLQLQQYQHQIPVNNGSNANTTLFNNLSLTQNQFSVNNQYPVFLDNPPVNTDIQNAHFFPPCFDFDNSNYPQFKFPATLEQTQHQQPYSTQYQPYQQIQPEDNPLPQHYTYDPSEY